MNILRAVNIVVAIGFTFITALSQQQAPVATPRYEGFPPLGGGKPQASGKHVEESRTPASADPARTPVFIENVGQFDSRVRFMAKTGGQTVWLTSTGVVFDSTRAKEDEKAKVHVPPPKLMLGRLSSGSID